MYLKTRRETSALIGSVSIGDPKLALEALGSVLERKKISVFESTELLRTLSPALSNRATDLLAIHLRKIGDHKSLRAIYLEGERPP